MKKILTTIIAVAAIAVSCNRHDAEQTPETVTVKISINNGSSVTKAVTDAADANQVVCAAGDLTALFADAAGNVLDSQEFGNMTNNIYEFTGVPSNVAQVAAIALRGAQAPTTLAQAEALWKTENVNAEAEALVVYGVDEVLDTKNEDGSYVVTAAVTVLPAHARVEVASINCTEFGTYSQVILQKMTLGTKYTQDIAATLTSTNATATAGNGKVWSWNLLEQAVSNLVVSMKVEGDGYTVAIPERTVTVNSYNVSGEPVTTFTAGNIYNFDIKFAYTNFDATDATVSADVTVTIGEWIVNDTEVGFATNK